MLLCYMMYSSSSSSELFLHPKVDQYGSHMVMTNVYRDSKKKYWNIDTQFRDDYQEYSSSSPTQYTFTLPQTINNVKNIRVVNMELPMLFDNVSTTLGNHLFVITYNSTEYTITIPNGSYDISALITKINAQINATALNGKIAVSNSGNYFVFTTSVSGTFVITFSVGSFVNNLVSFDKYNIKSKIGWMLGFRELSYTLQGATTLTSECVFDILRPKYVYLACDDYVNGGPNSFLSNLPQSVLNKNILAKITLDNKLYPVGSTLPANLLNGYLQSDKRVYSGITNLQRFKFQLVNEYGFSLHLNGADFSFCLEIEYE